MLDSTHKLNALVTKVPWLILLFLFVLISGTNGAAQNRIAKSRLVNSSSEEVQQPLYVEYRGVRLGMTAAETRAKLGTPVLMTDELDMYVFSTTETAQIAYNADRKVSTISTDYTGGVGAPDHQAVVGDDLQLRPDGSLYKMIQYRSQGYWVSYNKNAGPVPLVTVTLQALVK